MKTWLYHVNDFILLLLLSLLTERDELIGIVIFLATGYIGVFLIHKLMKKKTTGFLILLMTQIIGCSIFLPFSLFGTIMLPLFFFIVHVVGPGYPVQKSLGGIVWFSISAIFYAPFPPLWKLLLLVLHIMITFWLTGINRNQQLLRFASLITIGIISAFLIPIFPYIRLLFSYVVQVVALGFGYAINPLFSTAESKETDDFWSNKGNLKDPQIKDEFGHRAFDPTLINSITIIVCTTIAIYIVWKIIKKRKQFSLPNMPAFESTIITDKEGMSQKPLKQNKPPHNEIRKEIFKLESKLTPPLNRKRGETVEAWLGRINSEEDVNIESHIVIDAYNTVRYSNEENTVLLHEFKEEIQKLYAYQKRLKKRKK
ncbi:MULTISPECIES: DUF4018 domain-containing protein [Bacillus cereus group]|uniref:DUF4018 domain-containing protein n=1 Tax=Bacillus thuringiensis TaxID=1428 RepID=A0A1C4ERB8_BACTU|nr:MULTISPECIES: DUF4018 domain-containing protein [Bacillus cereus group]MED3024057.1 DUF4018 domain-containing protein [Bacillus wiedmannii]OTX98793.1 hypothetical protein BK729_12590 [Bacillus thuringiensis serovar wratislaviensis]OUB58229.1 hypothetical protein BK743_15065 [Bacillus thuringiensis serovar sylvestriensis]SCC46146.1 Uncharacterized protein BTT61001_03434 [Bacillus thuringiensis]